MLLRCCAVVLLFCRVDGLLSCCCVAALLLFRVFVFVAWLVLLWRCVVVVVCYCVVVLCCAVVLMCCGVI